MPRNRVLPLIAVAAVVAVLTTNASANPSGERRPRAVPVPTPLLTGPVQSAPHVDGTHGVAYTPSTVDLASHGYVEREYLVSGTARAYRPVGALGADGQWTVAPAGSAPYETRIVVRRPIDLHRFSGTVVVEWFNVTAGRDLDLGWAFGNKAIMNDGDVYVGVSAQAAGLTDPVQGAAAWDPARYAALHHPGDDYSYDIFSQVAQALRHPRGADPLAGARARRLIAYGDSQSAFRLVTYLDAVQNRDQLFDGVLVNSRFGNGAPLDATATPPAGTRIRADSTAKVLTIETETDVAGVPGGYLPARQPDSDRFRAWEVAGASHINAELEASMRVQAFREWPLVSPPREFAVCPARMDDLHFDQIIDSGLHALSRWVAHGTRPAHGTPLDVGATGYRRDALGIVTGGVRLPEVQAPIGVESGVGNSGGFVCGLVGTFTSFDAATLRSLYPTHDAYLRRVADAVRDEERAGFLQRYDGDLMLAQADASAVP